MYLTGSAPDIPIAPQTITGCITISTNAVAIIGNVAVNSSKMADNAVTNIKLVQAVMIPAGGPNAHSLVMIMYWRPDKPVVTFISKNLYKYGNIILLKLFHYS